MGRAAFSVVALACVGVIVHAEDWPRFRGQDGSATSDDTGLPTTWSETENVVWRTELPGAGTSSPVVLGDRVYVTSYSGYGLDAEEPGDMENLMRHVVCLDRKSGDIVWKRDFKPELPESKYEGGNNTWHGYASSTPVTDGQHLFVFFGKSGVYCLDLDGKEVWHADVGSKVTGWGSANSPVVFDDVVIVNALIESNSMRGLDKQTGKEVWKIEKIGGARDTPILVDAPDGQTELVLMVSESLVGYDPRTGSELWRCEGVADGGYVCSSPVAHDGVVYAVGGRKGSAIAVRAGGRGDVTETHRLWKTDKGANISSPVFYDGRLYWVHEKQGAAYCLDASTGEIVFNERLDPRPGTVYSSCVAADGKVYCVSQHNGTFVFAAGPTFEQLAHNVFADDDSRTNASPAISHGQLLMRNDRYLYCLGKP